jgi:hypothetical protein
MTVTHKTNFVPNPVQRNFIESRSKADLFSSRMGEGKSTAIAWACLYHTRHNPGACWAIIRDTFENLVSTTQKTFFQWFPPGVFGDYNASKKTFTWYDGIAKGDVIFLGMDAADDSSKLMSRELAGFAIDEPAPAVGSAGVDEMIFSMAMSRLRQQHMNWYGAKLAENNPDEAHWSYRLFVQPGTEGYSIWQPSMPENLHHLPIRYYEEMRNTFASRPDLVRRFVDGEFGFQQVGKTVTPQWSDKLHLALGLAPIARQDIYMMWDFGHNPTCLVAQRSPLGYLNFLDAYCGEEEGIEELIEHWAKPLWVDRYRPLGCPIRMHIGDPAGQQKEQTSYSRSAVRALRQALPAPWKSGPVKPIDRIPSLQALLTRNIKGKGLIQVDRERAGCLWHALRGGWHYHIARTGLVSGVAVKDKHSHPGDAASYGAAVLYPLGKVGGKASPVLTNEAEAGYFGGATRRIPPPKAPIGGGTPGMKVPEHGDSLPVMRQG